MRAEVNKGQQRSPEVNTSQKQESIEVKNRSQRRATEVNRSAKRPRFKINEGLRVELAAARLLVNFGSQACRLPLAAI